MRTGAATQVLAINQRFPKTALIITFKNKSIPYGDKRQIKINASSVQTACHAAKKQALCRNGGTCAGQNIAAAL
ncbi:hypothetical protein F6R98_11735 [Candidatus Methylospira mobilis]|uniref:Uncharacterized protein n=1 Tax=Candidatus Methylospira mobilis TaxID=1808979 RepID=A0A5Q0BN78_9GAMM|nr:hypothetical protein [Candidatus Methylospira mobilis]QFY43206.1 hypothetical protein F6R98_11735 [Candidatus Methylospira mobilis]